MNSDNKSLLQVLADNYMYYIVDESTREAYVVDLGDSSRLADIEKREDFEIKVRTFWLFYNIFFI